jgi:hypothetical protein
MDREVICGVRNVTYVRSVRAVQIHFRIQEVYLQVLPYQAAEMSDMPPFTIVDKILPGA